MRADQSFTFQYVFLNQFQAYVTQKMFFFNLTHAYVTLRKKQLTLPIHLT